MTEEDPIPIPEPSFEGDFVIDEVLALESGEVLDHPTLHYAVYGKLNADRSNAVLVCHALSGSARVGDWWPQLFLPGEQGLLDLERDCVIGINIFGSCYGSTGPASIDPATGKPYGPTFPLIGIRDIVCVQAKLIDHLGIHRLKLAIGASIGGMQVLEWAILFPERVARAISIGVAPLGAMGLGLNHLQRQAIMLDPAWAGGCYPPGHGPKGGLALARALGMVSYKSVPLLEERFARKPNRYGDENPWISTTAGQNGRFDVAGYLDYQGESFIPRFDANSYISITRTMDIFDPVRAHSTGHFMRIASAKYR
jgi:homoserine O-acetyltransferase